MKISLRFSIRFILSLLLFSSSAWSQKIMVKKTKGKNSIVESSIPLEEGMVYDLQTAPISENVNYQTKGLKSRQNSMMVGGSFVSLKGTDYQKNAGSLQLRYGWNFTQLEFGAAGEVKSTNLGAGATTDFLLGGYFDYNLITNRDPKPFIYGPFAFAGFGSVESPASKGGGSASILDSNLGGFITWFLSGSSAAIRVEGYFDYQQINTSLKQTDVMGFGTRGFLVYYF
ncbi:MAG: hypothetical protein H7328_11290 [Bdellovibrio sp.]|nr:hypothetical protein [Bdellovibrio sp.]